MLKAHEFLIKLTWHPFSATLSFVPELPDYDIDAEDRQWLDTQKQQTEQQGTTPVTDDQFEVVMDRLESESERKVRAFSPESVYK